MTHSTIQSKKTRSRIASSDDSRVCPICLSGIGESAAPSKSSAKRIIARLSACQHTFCQECILEWSKVIITYLSEYIRPLFVVNLFQLHPASYFSTEFIVIIVNFVVRLTINTNYGSIITIAYFIKKHSQIRIFPQIIIKLYRHQIMR